MSGPTSRATAPGQSTAVVYLELKSGARDARFTVVHIDGARTPGGRVFLCQHYTPELVWLPDGVVVVVVVAPAGPCAVAPPAAPVVADDR